MATTLSTDLFVPEVFADMIGPEIIGNLVMSQVAEVDTTLEGQPGDEITFARWNYNGPAPILTEGVPIVPRKLTQTKARGTILEAGDGIELTDTATLTALGNPNSAARENLALSVADRVDIELRKAAELTETVEGTTYAPLTVADADAPLSWARLTAGIALLGDRYNPRNLSLVISSGQHIQLLNDDSFISADKFGPGAVLQTGQVGAIGSIPVLISDRATTVGEDGAARTNALLVRRGALKLMYKRRPLVETGRDILKRTDVLTTNVHFGAKRVDDKGVVVIPTSVGI
jgi:N4-gp56 family major capsid protein